MVGASILVKQTTGLILSIVFIFYKMLIAKGKEEWKAVAKIIIFRLLGVLIPIILFLIYLLKNNIMHEFLDYAIYGIKQFSNYVSYIDLLKNYGKHITILAIVIPITILYMCYRVIIKEDKNLIFVLFAYSCASFTVVYPIADSVHFIIAAFPSIIALIYILNNFLKSKVKKSFKIIKYIINTIIISVFSLSSIYVVNYILNCDSYNDMNNFKYIPIRQGFKTGDCKC